MIPTIEDCDREEIHIPGSVQPHGLLLVVDEQSEIVERSAGGRSLAPDDCNHMPGRRVSEILGVSLAELAARTGAIIHREPSFLGTAFADYDRPGWNILAHRVEERVVIEVTASDAPPSAAGVLGRIRSVAERIGASQSLGEACAIAAREMSFVTGYQRTLVYRFLPDASGVVIAEQKHDHMSSLLNHHFPASDIPSQARELYRHNDLRLIPNVRYIPAPLISVPAFCESKPLDMSKCVLRSVSPIHIKYLMNMGVGASMSVSLMRRGELWGLIACHHSAQRYLTYEQQEICRHIGVILAQQIWAIEEAEGRQLISTRGVARAKVLRVLSEATDPTGKLFELAPELLGLVESHGVAVACEGTVATAGRVPSDSELTELAAWLRSRGDNKEIFSTDSLPAIYPAATAFASVGCGLLAGRTTNQEPVDIIWFRAEAVDEIKWAGNPHEPRGAQETRNNLNPRTSFETFIETLSGRCRGWSRDDIESAQQLQASITFILQQKKVGELNGLLSKANDQLQALAYLDGLTGLANRRAFDACLKREWGGANRSQLWLALVILDLDYFKKFNDRFGHLAGDECLRRVAEVLASSHRASDFPARYGGEEFCILLPHTDLSSAQSVAQMVLKRIFSLQIAHPDNPTGFVTASIGVAAAKPGRGDMSTDLIKTADEALYKAKANGRNQVAVLQPQGKSE